MQVNGLEVLLLTTRSDYDKGQASLDLAESLLEAERKSMTSPVSKGGLAVDKHSPSLRAQLNQVAAKLKPAQAKAQSLEMELEKVVKTIIQQKRAKDDLVFENGRARLQRQQLLDSSSTVNEEFNRAREHELQCEVYETRRQVCFFSEMYAGALDTIKKERARLDDLDKLKRKEAANLAIKVERQAGSNRKSARELRDVLDKIELTGCTDEESVSNRFPTCYRC